MSICIISKIVIIIVISAFEWRSRNAEITIMITIFDMIHMIIFIGANYIIYFYYSKIVIELVYLHIVTCTAFPYVTLHSQPFPITRLVAVLCYTCYFVPPNGLGALSICLHSCDAP